MGILKIEMQYTGKYSSATILLAATLTQAVTQSTYVPIDCYQESGRAFGNQKSTKLSDIDLLSGLHPLNHKLNTISACTDMATNLISGVVTSYAEWNNGQ